VSDMLTLAFIALLSELQHGGGGGQAGPPGPPGPPAPYPDPGPAPAPAPLPAPHPAPAPHTIPPAGDQPGPFPRPPPVPVPHAPVVPPGPGPVPPMPPWPTPPTPGTLPPFPGPGWCPDTPVTPAVSARALYWNPQLWNYAARTIRKAFVQEMLGGQWVTFAAAWHPGDKGPQTYMATEAWRVCTAPPVAPPAPAPTPPPAPPPAPLLTPLQQAAIAMNNALAADGYRKSDQGVYMAFQAQAFPSSKPDGFPGTHTMGALHDALASAGVTMAPVTVYPWLAGPGYDGVNAPTLAEWNR